MVGIFGSGDIAHTITAAGHAAVFGCFLSQFSSFFGCFFGGFGGLLLCLFSGLCDVFLPILFQFGEVFGGALRIFGRAGLDPGALFLISHFVPRRPLGCPICIARGTFCRIIAAITARASI